MLTLAIKEYIYFLDHLKGKLHNTNFYTATISALLAACKLSAQIKKIKRKDS